MGFRSWALDYDDIEKASLLQVICSIFVLAWDFLRDKVRHR